MATRASDEVLGFGSAPLGRSMHDRRRGNLQCLAGAN